MVQIQWASPLPSAPLPGRESDGQAPKCTRLATPQPQWRVTLGHSAAPLQDGGQWCRTPAAAHTQAKPPRRNPVRAHCRGTPAEGKTMRRQADSRQALRTRCTAPAPSPSCFGKSLPLKGSEDPKRAKPGSVHLAPPRGLEGRNGNQLPPEVEPAPQDRPSVGHGWPTGKAPSDANQLRAF